MTTRINSPRALLTAITLTSLSTWATATQPAQATQPTAPTNNYAKVVRYTELDLTRTTGVTILYDRIKRAAQAVCDPFRGYSVQRFRYEQDCVDQAVAEAVAKVAHPNVTAYHQAKTS
jgi:UrcA family protein